MTSLTLLDELDRMSPMSEDQGHSSMDCVVSLDGVVIGYDHNNPLVRVPVSDYLFWRNCSNHRFVRCW